MSTSYLLGRPEWANDDDEAANEFAASLQPSEKTQASDEFALRRAEWAAVAAFYWAEGYIALEKRDFALMRTKAKAAQDAEKNSGPDAALLVGIFGGELPIPPYNQSKRGATISKELSQMAKKGVMAEIKRHADAKKPKVEEVYRSPELKDKSASERAAVVARAAADLPKDCTGVEAMIKALPGVKKAELIAAGFDSRFIFASGAKTNRRDELFI